MRYRYEAEIIGDCPPFKWQVSSVNETTGTSATCAGVTGEADCYDGALLDAAKAAHVWETARRWRTTKCHEVLFHVEDVEPAVELGSE